MAMHYRRHNPPTGGAANPFTGRSLPTGRSAGGGGRHGNNTVPSSLLVPSMTKKAVLLVLTFTIFFYFIFAPDYDDGSSYDTTANYRQQQQPPSITKKEDSSSSSTNKSFVPVKLKLPSEITHDSDIERGEEKEVESADYEDKRMEHEEEEEEEEGIRFNYKDSDERSNENGAEEDNESNDKATTEAEEQLSPAEKVYGAHVEINDGKGNEEDNSQSDPFLGLLKSDDKSSDEESALDNSRGGLRGSKSVNENPFGRQEKTDDDDNDDKKEEEVEQGVESSGDDPEDIDKTFYKNQSPLEVPNSVVEDESTKSKIVESIDDTNEQGVGTETATKPCQDDPDFRYNDHNCEYVSEREKCNKLHNGEKVGIVSCPVSCGMVDDCFTRLHEKERSHVDIKINEDTVVVRAKTVDEKDNSEVFSSKEKAAFEARYGSAHKSMEDEANEQDVDSSVFKNQPPLEIPIVDASVVMTNNETDVKQSTEKKSSASLSMEEDVDKQPKSMADEVDNEDQVSGDEDLKVKKTEDAGGDSKTVEKGLKTMSNDLDAEDEQTVNDEDKDEPTKASEVTSQQGDETDGDYNVNNKAASSVEDKFKEYLITNSEDEPKKDENTTEDREAPLDMSKDYNATLGANHENISKVDQSEKSVVGKEKEVEDIDETLKNSERNDASEQEDDADEDFKAKKTSSIRGAVDEKSKHDPHAVEKDHGDVVDDESVAEEGKIKDTDVTLQQSEGSNDASEKGDEADEDSSAKKTSSIRGTADDNASEEVEEDLDEETADKSIKESDNSSDLGKNADEESKVKNLEDVNTDLSDSQAFSNHGNETTSQIDKNEESLVSAEEANGSGDDEERGSADEDSKGKKVVSISSGFVIQESDTVKVTENIETGLEDNEDINAKLEESKEKADEFKKNDDSESSDKAQELKQDVKSDLSEKVEDDFRQGKIGNERKESAENKDVSVDTETRKKENSNDGESEESPVDKDEKVIPIQGDLGEAIKESDASVTDEEATTDNEEMPDGKHDEDEESARRRGMKNRSKNLIR